MFLEVPEAQCGGNRANCLGDPEVGQLKKREGDKVVLDNRY